MALFGLTVILYTAVGGFRAVVLTDAIQGMVMVFASVVVLVAVVNAGGGMERCVATLKAIDPGLITPTGPGDAVPQPMILSFWASASSACRRPRKNAWAIKIRGPCTTP